MKIHFLHIWKPTTTYKRMIQSGMFMRFRDELCPCGANSYSVSGSE